jgi:hypothetical protein
LPSARLALRSLALILAATSISAGQPPRPAPRLFHALPAGGQSGRTVEITVTGTDLDAADGLWFSDPGLIATPIPGKPKVFRVAIPPTIPSRDVDIRVLTPDGVSNPRVFVVGSRPETGESEPNNTPESANPVAVNAVVNGSFAQTDVDCFAFQGKRGQRIFLSLAAEQIESKLDATLRLLDARGVELAESRDALGADPSIDVTLPADGRYVAKIHDVTYAGSPDHFYRLTIDDGPHLDAVFPAIAEPGKPRRLTLIGRHLGGSPMPDRGIDGRPIEAKEIDVTPAFRPAPDLPFLLARSATTLVGQAITVGSSNPVILSDSAGPVIVEREPNPSESPQGVVLPCSIGGDFRTPGDLDVYRFTAKKGDVWRVEAIAEGIGSPADPTLTIQRVGVDGTPTDLVTADDTPDPGLSPRFNLASVDATLRWIVPADGTYQVLVNDLAGNSRSGPSLYYHLSIRHESPTFRLFVVPTTPNALDSVTLRAGGRTSAIVLAWRIDGFTGPIWVVPSGLPPGLRAEPVVIPEGQVSATIVFEADATAKPSVGLVRLVGLGSTLEMATWKTGFRPDVLLGADRRFEAIPGSASWPPVKSPNAPRAPVASVRATRGFVVAIRDGSPFLLTAKPRRAVVAAGQPIDLDLTLKRSPGFDDAVTIAAPDLPTGFAPPTGSIAKAATETRVALPVPKAGPGVYSLVVRGAGTFKTDPKKPAVKVDEPSNPVVVTVRPAPFALTLVSKPPTLKPGQSADVEIKVERKGTFQGPISLLLDLPSASKLHADRITIAANQTGTKFAIRSDKDAPAGSVATTIRTEAVVDGETIEIALPLPVTIPKP